tara:strand:- start:1175 stop:1402 length:228 start_codon:yes stop_codon:yes gene_type:complete
MNTYRITCREYAYFVKEVEADSAEEAREKLHNNVNSFKTTMEWDDEWEIADVETKEDHEKGWIDHAPRTNVRDKS